GRERPHIGVPVDVDPGDRIDHVSDEARAEDAALQRLRLRLELDGEPTPVESGGKTEPPGHGQPGRRNVGHTSSWPTTDGRSDREISRLVARWRRRSGRAPTDPAAAADP